MKERFFWILISILFVCGCRCDDCFIEYPYLTFAMHAKDTLNHPISKNQQLRIYTYYAGGSNWETKNIFDSSRTYNLNWKTHVLNASGDSVQFYCAVDHKISPSGQVVDLDKYNYRLVSILGDLEIKISKMKVKTDSPEGRCGCEKSRFESCTVNDSLTDFKRIFLVY